MVNRRGFSLIEIIVVLVIVGILAAMAMFNFKSSIEQANAQQAKNNLMAIVAAQQKYFEDYALYCTTTTGNTASCGTVANLITNMKLSVAANDPYSYSCLAVAAGTPAAINPATFSCTAIHGALVTLNLGAVYSGDGTQVLGFGVTCPTGGSMCPS